MLARGLQAWFFNWSEEQADIGSSRYACIPGKISDRAYHQFWSTVLDGFGDPFESAIH